MRHALHWLPAAGLLAATALPAAAGALGAPAFLTSALAAPLYYLIPLGVGLLLTVPLATSVTRTQRALCAYLIGLIAVCALLVAREHGTPAKAGLHLVAAGITCASLAGFALSGNFFRWDSAARGIVLEYALVFPVFLIGYWFRFVVLSEYPATDLFQLTHLMKGALDFGRFDMLNPFTAGSYPPVIPAVEGMLFRYLAFEPLHGIWILPVLSTALKFAALHAAVSGVIAERSDRVFTIAVAACFMSVFTPTNGELAMLGSLALFSIVLSTKPQAGPELVRCIFVGAGGFITAYLAARAAPPAYLVVLGIACAAPLAGARFGVPPGLLAILPLMVAIEGMHRSAMLFVPLTIACALLVCWLGRSASWTAAGTRRLVLGTGALTALIGSATIALLGWLMLHPAEDLRQLDAYRWIVAVLLQTVVDDNPEILSGSGPKVALFELGRAMTPSFVGFAVGLTAYAAVRVARHGGSAAPQDGASQQTRDAVVACLVSVALGSILLLGVPFAYRAGFLIILLLAIALAAALADAEREPAARRVNIALLVLAGGYGLAVVPIAYRCAPLLSCERSAYGNLVQPFLAGLIVLSVFASLAGVLAYRLVARRQALVRIALVLLFALEFAASKAYFFPYAYGAGPQNGVVSHLSTEEVRLANRIRGLGSNVILVSDPVTMANLRALTGLNSLLTFSNLDTLVPGADARFRSWFRELLDSEDRGACSGSSLMMALGGALSSAEFNYWLARLSQPDRSGVEILADFGFRSSFVLTAEVSDRPRSLQAIDHLWYSRAIRDAVKRVGPLTFLVVINRKTVQWARGNAAAGYYPDVRVLESTLVGGLELRCGAQTLDRRFVTIAIPVPDDGDSTRRGG